MKKNDEQAVNAKNNCSTEKTSRTMTKPGSKIIIGSYF